MESTHPIAYYRLTANIGSSEVGTKPYTAAGTLAPIVVVRAAQHRRQSVCTVLDGKTGYFDTTQMGEIRGAGSMLAWANLSVLPSVAGRIVYIAGISQNANDFDFAIRTRQHDPLLHRLGIERVVRTSAATLAGRWHMIVATFNAATGTRAIYWDGQLAMSDHRGGTPGKNNESHLRHVPLRTSVNWPHCVQASLL